MASGPLGTLGPLGGPYTTLRRSAVDPVTGNATLGAHAPPSATQLGGAYLDLLGQRAWDAISAPSRAYSGELQVWDPETGHASDAALGAASGMAGLAMTGGLGGVAGKTGGTALGSGPIRAYHGSPHDFDKFSLSKIGTGEGAQAYGHGLYFAGNEAVAKTYRDNLSPMTFRADGRLISDDAGRLLAESKVRNGANLDDVIASLSQELKGAPNDPGTAHMREYLSRAQELRNAKIEAAPTGHMYEVGIYADPAKMLDYDAGLAGQVKGVQEYGSHLLGKMQDQGLMRGQGLADIAGADIPYMTNRLGIAPAAVSESLSSLGVPGVKYLDAGSRFSAEKSHNYVTFSDNIVKILRKYGVASVAALPPAVRAVVESGRIPDGSDR